MGTSSSCLDEDVFSSPFQIQSCLAIIIAEVLLLFCIIPADFASHSLPAFWMEKSLLLFSQLSLTSADRIKGPFLSLLFFADDADEGSRIFSFAYTCLSTVQMTKFSARVSMDLVGCGIGMEGVYLSFE